MLNSLREGQFGTLVREAPQPFNDASERLVQHIDDEHHCRRPSATGGVADEVVNEGQRIHRMSTGSPSLVVQRTYARARSRTAVSDTDGHARRYVAPFPFWGTLPLS